MNEPISKFTLTDLEQAKLQHILDWQEQSVKSTMMFGPSNFCQKCNAINNPNNVYCHQCGFRL